MTNAGFALPPEGNVARLLRMASSFAVLHTLHTLLNLAYTLVQLLVFARLLAADRYAEVVFLTAVGVYIQPFNQAMGRANYVALRPATVTAAVEPRGEVTWFLHAQAGLLTAISFAVPLVFGLDDPQRYLANALYLFGCLFTNFWSYDLQSTVWSADLGRAFAAISIVRRALFFAGLALFWATGSFLAFGLLTTLVIVVFIVIIARFVDARSAALSVFPSRGTVTRGNVVAHLKQLWVSLLSALSELLVLNSPYALLTALFGVGPVLVAFDSVTKVGRLAMAGTRTFAEISLPRVSRLVMTGDGRGGQRAFVIVFAVCLLATAVPAGAVFWYGPTVFDLLLGHNNVVPPAASTSAALIILTTGLYQPAVFFLSYLNAQSAIRTITWMALAGFVLYSLLIIWIGGDVISTLWIYAAYFLFLSCAATVFAFRISDGVARK